MGAEVLRVAMNGVTGRMGYRQHLLRSVLAIRDDGGVELTDGRRVRLEPVLVGRNRDKLAELAERHGIAEYSTDLEAVLADATIGVYFDAQLTGVRRDALLAAIRAGKHIYAEKPVVETVEDALEIADRADAAGLKTGVVHDKLYLPGLRKLRRLIDNGFFGRVLSVRGEFGYWVFEGTSPAAQRPSWNYRAEDGGGITVDMFAHWAYVLENLFGRVEAVVARTVTHIPERVDEQGATYAATADDAAYAIFELAGGAIAQINSSWCVRVDRQELVEFQVDGVEGSAVAGLWGCRVQHRGTTPRPVWNPDLPATESFRDQWTEVPDNAEFGNGFRAQWEEFVRHVAGDPGAPAYRHDVRSGARGIQLARAGLQSSAEGRRITLERLP
jgi:predicted dehydrogenase